MAQGRHPAPFRTRKLRPGTAMVLHPEECGRVARRRYTRQESPRGTNPEGFSHILISIFLPPHCHREDMRLTSYHAWESRKAAGTIRREPADHADAPSRAIVSIEQGRQPPSTPAHRITWPPGAGPEDPRPPEGNPRLEEERVRQTAPIRNAETTGRYGTTTRARRIPRPGSGFLLFLVLAAHCHEKSAKNTARFLPFSITRCGKYECLVRADG